MNPVGAGFLILALILVSNPQAHAFRVQGFNKDCFVFAKAGVKVKAVSLQTCEAQSCENTGHTVACKNSGAEKWVCQEPELPATFRFQVETDKGTRESKYESVTSVRDQCAIHVDESALEIVHFPSHYSFDIGLQETFENVFHPSDVTAVRRIDALRSNGKSIVRWEPHGEKTPAFLYECEDDACRSGRSKKVRCSLYSQGIRALSFICPLQPFARYARLIVEGKDRTRESSFFALKDTKSVLIKSDTLELIQK